MPVSKRKYRKQVRQTTKVEAENQALKQHIATSGHKVPASRMKKGKIVIGAAGANIGLGVVSNAIWDKHNNKTINDRKSNYPTTRTHAFAPDR